MWCWYDVIKRSLISNGSESFAFLDSRTFKALFHAGTDLRMELYVEGAVVSPRCVKLCRVLVHQVSVFCTTWPTKVLYLDNIQTYILLHLILVSHLLYWGRCFVVAFKIPFFYQLLPLLILKIYFGRTCFSNNYTLQFTNLNDTVNTTNASIE